MGRRRPRAVQSETPREMPTSEPVSKPASYDHEHPCPTATMCVAALRAQGFADVPDDMQCCVCWRRESGAS